VAGDRQDLATNNWQLPMASGFNIDVDVPKTVTVGVVSVLLLAVILLGAHGLYLKVAAWEFQNKNYTGRSELVTQHDLATADIYRNRWVNEQNGTVAVSVNEAIELMAASKGRPPTTQPLGPVKP
jgi:hypothetical protein